jgi:polygalacturonase
MSTDFSRRNALTQIVGAGAAVAIGSEFVGALSASAQTNTHYPPGNVLNFGADPTGQMDSAAAIQAAINYVSGASSW